MQPASGTCTKLLATGLSFVKSASASSIDGPEDVRTTGGLVDPVEGNPAQIVMVLVLRRARRFELTALRDALRAHKLVPVVSQQSTSTLKLAPLVRWE